MSTPDRAEQVQALVQVLIVVAVGLMAGAASFHHVHDFTMRHSPAGTADWFGWANAVISELIPTAALIEVGRRRRRDPQAAVRYPMVLLVGAVGFSLTAQLAVATPSVFGWMVSALPALAFFGLSKLVFTATTARPAAAPAGTTPADDTTPADRPPPASPPDAAAVTPVRPTVPASFLPPPASSVNGHVFTTGGAR